MWPEREMASRTSNSWIDEPGPLVTKSDLLLGCWLVHFHGMNMVWSKDSKQLAEQAMQVSLAVSRVSSYWRPPALTYEIQSSEFQWESVSNSNGPLEPWKLLLLVDYWLCGLCGLCNPWFFLMFVGGDQRVTTHDRDINRPTGHPWGLNAAISGFESGSQWPHGTMGVAIWPFHIENPPKLIQIEPTIYIVSRNIS